MCIPTSYDSGKEAVNEKDKSPSLVHPPSASPSPTNPSAPASDPAPAALVVEKEGEGEENPRLRGGEVQPPVYL